MPLETISLSGGQTLASKPEEFDKQGPREAWDIESLWLFRASASSAGQNKYIAPAIPQTSASFFHQQLNVRELLVEMQRGFQESSILKIFFKKKDCKEQVNDRKWEAEQGREEKK